MFREIGLELSVRESAVIGIFDLDNVSWSKQSRAFLSRALSLIHISLWYDETRGSSKTRTLPLISRLC